MNIQDILDSAQRDLSPPPNLSDEGQVLWHIRAGNWDTAHNIAQEIHTPTGSWLHALLHLIEGDHSNAGYWFRKASRPARPESEIDQLWREIAEEIL
ncbi:MAG: hypothetical protein R3C49_07745 [Planctomycetaceae bacterium]